MRRLFTLVLFAGALLATAPASAQRALPEDPNVGRAREHYSAGWGFMQSEDFEKAAAEFQLATDFNPKLAMAWYGLGRANMAMRKYQQALLNLEECRNLFTAEVSRKFNSRMDADRARRDRLLELEDMRNQLLKGPQTNQARDMVRLLENRMRDTTQIIERETSVEFENPVPAFVSLSLGSAYFRKERFAEAERAFRDAIRADDTSGAAHNNLAVLYLMQRRFANADEHARKAERAGFFVDPEVKGQIAAGIGHAARED